jgi:capsular polysaccharide biosynthesis protein
VSGILLKKVARRLRSTIGGLATLCREALFSFSIWTPRTPATLNGSVTEFVKANSKYWSAGKDNRPGILVEGHLSQYGPNYLLRTAVAAKAIQEKTNLDIEVVFNGLSHQWVVAKQVYESFYIRKFIYLGRLYLLSNAWRRVRSRVVAARIWRKLRGPEDILSIEYDGIPMGDLIYDDILKLTGKKTIERIDRDVGRAVAKSHYFYLQYRSLFRQRLYDYYVSTHTQYSEYGILCRVALSQGVKVIETTDIQMSFYADIARDNLPTYHDGIRSSIVRELGSPRVDLDGLRESARASLQRRLTSQVKQLDVEKAYRGKAYTRAELRTALKLEHEGKIVFVLAHIFSDAPHLSSGMLHADYYQWLASTLRICARARGVHWVVKPHPSVSIYGEEGMVEKMVDGLGSQNVSICPADLNTKSLSDCADALVTVHGTAGLEFSCLGVAAVLAGSPFYSGFGFTIEPDSIAEYESTLLALDKVTALPQEKIDRALEVYAIWDRQFDWSNPIITTDVLANVWGSGRPRNLEKAYQLITDNLRVCDPRKLKLWKFAQSVTR